MKARVYYNGAFWYGEVYADWAVLGKCWRNVTSCCFTKVGAVIALKNWIRKNRKYEVSI